MNIKISVTIITLNEEKNIAKCLEKLSFADEIIVIDSGSVDKTIEICNEYKAKVIHNKFENYGLQKQFAVNQTKNDWVLSLDADEVLSNELVDEIINLNFSDATDGYLVPRTHVFMNKVFKYGGENKRPILRIFNKKKGRFIPNKVHEVIEVEGKLGILKNEMLHYTVSDFSDAINKEIKYSLLGGEFLFEKGKKASLFKIIVKLPFEFFKVYFLQLNLLNGFQGYVWAVTKSIGSMVKYIKLYELDCLKIKDFYNNP